MAAPPTTPSPNYMGIPVEIRRQTFGLLLKNELLGKHHESGIDGYGSAKYGLSAQVLRVNRQLYEEASTVLYNENIFYFSFFNNWCETGRLIHKGEIDHRGFPVWNWEEIEMNGTSPLIRYQYERNVPLWSLPQMKNVKRWRILVFTAMGSHPKLLYSSTLNFSTRLDLQNGSQSLKEFARAICRNGVQDLDILVVNDERQENYVESEEDLGGWVLDEDPMANYYMPMGKPLEVVLQPLTMIRNVQHCRIRNPTPDDFEGRRPKMNLSTHDEKLLGSHLGLTKETCDTMKSQTKIEHAFEMWEWLLEYAQSFESRHLFYEVSVPTYECNDPIETVYSDDFERDKIKNKWLEVMKDHPVEQAMKRANMASYEDDLASFKRQRSRVVHFLEDQYQREVKTWTKLCQFIQGYDLNAHTFFEEYPDDAYQRRTPGFKPDDHFWSLEERNDCAPEIAITYLRDCVDAFKRDMSSELKNTIRLHEYSLKKKNKSDDEQTTAKKRQSLECKRTRLMESLTRAYDDFDVAALRSNFKEVVDGLEEEFRRVRRARKALLTSDVLDKPEVDLGEDEDEVDDRIDWDATGWNTESKTVLAWAYWDFPDYYHTEDGWKKKEKVDQKVDEGVDIEPYWWNGL